MSSPVLEVRGLGRKFGGLQAVSDLSFSVPAGHTLGVIGPNGAGKSTFINLVTGHLRPSSGRILIGDHDMTGAKPWKIAAAGVARTFQIVKPFRGMTVRENVAVGLLHRPGRIASMRQALVEADTILERVRLADERNKAPAELSVAASRRLEFAKALALNPRLLLLDEVMAGLRPNEIEPSLDLINELRDGGMSIIAVEHVMKAILAISDTVMVLQAGRLLMSGKPRDVLSDDRVIEAYLGQRYAKNRGR